MWLVRGIVGLFFIFLAIISLVSPIVRGVEPPVLAVMAIIALAFAALGVWIMGGNNALGLAFSGWLPRPIRKQLIEKQIQREIEIRKSRWFGLRNRLMGIVALTIGFGGLMLAYISNDWNMNWRVWTGLLLFIALGFWYLIKGRNAESQTPVDSESRNTLTSRSRPTR